MRKIGKKINQLICRHKAVQTLYATDENGNKTTVYVCQFCDKIVLTIAEGLISKGTKLFDAAGQWVGIVEREYHKKRIK